MKKRKILLISLILLLSMSLIACGDNTSSEVDKEEFDLENKEETKNKIYELGEEWEVKDNWKLKIDSVTETEDRNQFSDKNPAQVVIIKYTYENLGYEGDIQDLFITPETVIDQENKLGYHYPATTNTHPQDTPVGAICEGAEEAFGLDNKSDTIKIHFQKYDKDGEMHKAIFEVPVE